MQAVGKFIKADRSKTVGRIEAPTVLKIIYFENFPKCVQLSFVLLWM